MEGEGMNWSGGYMIYVGIDIAKKKFDYCIIDSELSVIKRGIIKEISNYLWSNCKIHK